MIVMKRRLASGSSGGDETLYPPSSSTSLRDSLSIVHRSAADTHSRYSAQRHHILKLIGNSITHVQLDCISVSAR